MYECNICLMKVFSHEKILYAFFEIIRTNIVRVIKKSLTKTSINIGFVDDVNVQISSEVAITLIVSPSLPIDGVCQ